MSLIVIVLCLIIIFLIIYIGFILNQLNSINKQLHKRLSENTRQPLNVGLFNKTIIKLASNINHCLKLEEKRRLDSINEQKQFKELISNISHDLRTPLTSIKGYQQLLQKSDLDKEQLPVLCAASREIPGLLQKMLWDREEGMSAILTSGTLKAGAGFLRTRQVTGLEERIGVQEYVAESPFSYEKNCLLYLPKTLEHCRRGSREEALMVANHIHSLSCSTYGHTLVLFTSYTLMGSVYQILRDRLPFPMVEVWRHSQEEILRFKTMENGVLFAAGSCWEGVDFPGDMVSSLIIVKLPFAVPDPISEAEKETYDSLETYIQSIIVPDMQKKLRQGFGRAIRTETDTCVVSILDIRAVKGGKYHEDVMCALPPCRIAEELKEVQDFIRSRKGVEYYL